MDETNRRRVKFMAKPIEATPILKGQDLVNLVESLYKERSQASRDRRAYSREFLKKAREKK